MIVGFDSDGPDIFTRQYEFAMASNVPIFSCGALNAPDRTPLQSRLRAEGRLRTEGPAASGTPFATNIDHPRMSHARWLGGLRWLVSELYHPDRFRMRMLGFTAAFGPRQDPDFREPMRFIDQRRIVREAAQMVHRHAEQSDADGRLLRDVLAAAKSKPGMLTLAYESLIQYVQVRHMLAWGESSRPQSGKSSTVGSLANDGGPPL